MKVTEATAIPYEKQSNQESSRTCGAACLTMVYRSFGKEIPQAEIWTAIAKRNGFGSVASTTYLMTQDALNRGFAAVAIQARHPLQVLRLCRDRGIRAILNHRLRRDAPTGHYSVLVDIDDKSVVLHDPSLGPLRRLGVAELLDLWLPKFGDSEIAGNVLIAVAAAGVWPVTACEFCHSPMPADVQCPNCKKDVCLEPGAVLGCMSDACIARAWNRVCCPSCDYVWSVSRQASCGGTSAENQSSPVSPDPKATSRGRTGLDVNKLFGEIDKFCSHLLSVPAVANHPEIKKQLDHITAAKEKFKPAYAEQLACHRRLLGEFAMLAKRAEEQEEANRKRLEELNRPVPPLDGNALGCALLKNLGLAG